MKKILFLILLLSVNTYGAVYTTTHTADTLDYLSSGIFDAGSLRWAMTMANMNANSTINFQIPTTDIGYNGTSWTICPSTPLPVIVTPGTYIDGTTQSSIVDNPNGLEIEIRGSSVTDYANISSGGTYWRTTACIKISTVGVTIRGLCISSWTASAINIIRFGTNAGEGQPLNIMGNYIGTDVNGMIARGNTTSNTTIGSIILNTRSSITVGGLSAGDRNLVCGSIGYGIQLQGLISSATIIGNYIGMNKDGLLKIPNQQRGIHFQGGNRYKVLNNVISGNGSHGIYVFQEASSNTISGNYIGTDKNGAGSVSTTGNGGNGIYFITNSSDNIATGNTIAYNTGDGIQVDNNADRITMSMNSIYENTSYGIDLGANGPTGTSTANDGISLPAVNSALNGVIVGTSVPSAIVEVFISSAMGTSTLYGQGITYLGSTTADGSGNWSLTLWNPYSTYITANSSVTATQTQNNNTSEFSLNQLYSVIVSAVKKKVSQIIWFE